MTIFDILFPYLQRRAAELALGLSDQEIADIVSAKIMEAWDDPRVCAMHSELGMVRRASNVALEKINAFLAGTTKVVR